MKKLTTYIFSAISIFSLVYFTVKYYFDGALNFNRNNIMVWTILVFVILLTLILGIVNNRELQTIKSQNENIQEQNTNLMGLVVKLVGNNDEAHKILAELSTKVIKNHEDTHDELLTTLLNSREIELDIYNKLKDGET